MTCPTVTLKHLGEAPAPSRRAQVTFAFGSAALDATARTVLDGLADDLKNARRLRLEGYTDTLGPDDLNLELSQQRARAVRDYLLQDAANAELSVQVDARGACCFVAPNQTGEGRALNRRVEIQLDARSPL